MAHITGTHLCSVEAASLLRAHTSHTRTMAWVQPLPPVHCVVPSLAVDPCEHENALDAPASGVPHVGVQAIVGGEDGAFGIGLQQRVCE